MRSSPGYIFNYDNLGKAMEAKNKQDSSVGNKYSQQFLFICKNDEDFDFRESLIREAYKNKWSKTQNDPDFSRLHIINVNNNDQFDDKKFECLKLADSHSRITIVGHHKLDSDYFFFAKNMKIHYKKIIDIVRANVISESILLHSEADVQSVQRALRITFYACNIGVGSRKRSLAEKIFDYASNHKEKPLRIEMTAPTMFCRPMLIDKNIKLDRKHPLSKVPNSMDSLHKRYITVPFYRGKFFLFGKSAGLFSFFYPQYRPGNHKKILKINASVSELGNIKPKMLSPEDENVNYKLGK